MNSAIVLWLLSSVLLAGLTHVYSTRQSEEAEQARKRELLRKLDTEIGNRIYQTFAGLDSWKGTIAAGGWPGTTRGMYGLLAQYLNNTLPNNIDYSVFSEYRSRSFTSLLIELGSLVEPSEVADMKDTLTAYHQIAVLSSAMAGERPNTTADIDQAMSMMREHFRKRRWTIPLYPER